MDAYLPDSNLARWLNRGGRLRLGPTHPAHAAETARRKAIVEPVNGVLKEQGGMRRFPMKGLAKVAVEWTLASTAYNLTRM